MIAIRQATLEDLPRIVEMAVRFNIESLYAEICPVSRERLTALAELLIADHVIFVAERTLGYAGMPPVTVIVGMLAMAVVPHLLTGRDYGQEVAWWVDTEHRHTSAGPRLMHKMQGWASQKSLHMVIMLAPADSTVGRFYQQCGYRAVETSWVKVLTDGLIDGTGAGGAHRRPGDGEAEEDARDARAGPRAF